MELRPRTDWSTKLTVERVREDRSWLNTERNLLKSLSEDGAESHGDSPIWLTGTAPPPGGYGTDAPGLSLHLVPWFQVYSPKSSSAAPLLHPVSEKASVEDVLQHKKSFCQRQEKHALVSSSSFSSPASSSWSAAGKGMPCSPAEGCGVKQRKAGIAQKPSHTSFSKKGCDLIPSPKACLSSPKPPRAEALTLSGRLLKLSSWAGWTRAPLCLSVLYSAGGKKK